MLKPVIKDHNTQLGLVSGHSVQTLDTVYTQQLEILGACVASTKARHPFASNHGPQKPIGILSHAVHTPC